MFFLLTVLYVLIINFAKQRKIYLLL